MAELWPRLWECFGFKTKTDLNFELSLNKVQKVFLFKKKKKKKLSQSFNLSGKLNFPRHISNVNICPNPCLAKCAHTLTFVLVPLGFNFTAPWKPNKKLVILPGMRSWIWQNICSNISSWQVTCSGYKYISLQLFCLSQRCRGHFPRIPRVFTDSSQRTSK